MEQKEQAKQFLGNMLRLLGFDVEISVRDDEENFGLSLQVDEPGRLIGRKGHYLQSLELVLNRYMKKHNNDSSWVQLDIDGYQRKRPGSRSRSNSGGGEDSERMIRMAMDIAKEVKKWGEEKSTQPLSARDRRAVHMALKEDSEIITESGEEVRRGMKKVIVRLVE